MNYNLTQISELIKKPMSQILYHIKKGTIPQGERIPFTRKRFFTEEEKNMIVAYFSSVNKGGIN